MTGGLAGQLAGGRGSLPPHMSSAHGTVVAAVVHIEVCAVVGVPARPDLQMMTSAPGKMQTNVVSCSWYDHV